MSWMPSPSSELHDFQKLAVETLCERNYFMVSCFHGERHVAPATYTGMSGARCADIEVVDVAQRGQVAANRIAAPGRIAQLLGVKVDPLDGPRDQHVKDEAPARPRLGRFVHRSQSQGDNDQGKDQHDQRPALNQVVKAWGCVLRRRLPATVAGHTNGRNRHVPAAPVRPVESPLTEPTAAVQQARREPLFMPHFRPSIAQT